MINFKNKETNKNNSGFTIIETLAAIFILLISITGPMVFAQSSLRAAFQSRDQITAFYLAQDAIEFVKNYRDDAALSGATSENWLVDLESSCSGGAGCRIDTLTGDVLSCEGAASHPGCDNPLKINSNGFFGHNGNQDSIFIRTIYIREVPGFEGGEAEVAVRILWTSHDSIGQREIVVAENIYNWPNILLGGNN